ncbi:trichohyalin-like [Hemibagrus wyckioides]|uniref:trichohyalin-like n=1 Tax=Hemibagrus wyckioides TaxID=337641 RepID=UPI00266B5F7A|nr:trichohyalin-like [Hemibagrus wyckioides]
MLHLISLTGAGIYYFMKKRRDGEKTAEHTDTPDPEDPVQTGSLLDPGLKCGDETQTDSAVPQGSVSEAEEKSQKGEVSGSLLDSERSILEEQVREVEEVLCEAERESERKHKVTLAESEEKHKQATESVEQMQKQDADLKSQIDTLKDTVQQLGHLLTQKHTECTDTTRLYETELNLRKRVQSEYKQKKEKFNQETRSLRVALNEAEWKYEQAMEFSAQLENSSLKECEREKEAHSVLKVDQMTSTHHEELLQGIQAKATELYRESHDHLKREELKNEVNKLRESVQQLERELSESCRKCEEIKRECERDQEHHSVLKCDQMTSTHLLELVQVSQAEAEEKFEYTAQLENENSDLKSQVNTLQDTVQGLRSLIAETHRKCEKTKKEHKVTEGILQFVETRARKRERFLIQKRKSIQESLDERERKYMEMVKIDTRLRYDLRDIWDKIAKSNAEKNSLKEKVQVTRRTLEQRTQELVRKTHQLAQIDPNWKCLNETVMKDHEAECLAHGLLKVQYSEMKQQHDKLEEDNEQLREAYSTLESQYEELKHHHGSQMECEREQEAHHVQNVQCHEMKESSSHTEESVRVDRQQSSVQQAEEKLTAIRRKCGEIKRERKREREDYNLLKARCQQMEETLQEYEELLKTHCTDLGSKGTTDP